MGSKVRDLHERRGWAYGLVFSMTWPVMRILTKRRYINGERIPEYGGCVVAVNHISYADPVAFGLFLHDLGRLVRYLAKDAIWKYKPIAVIFNSGRQIPVSRLSAGAASAYQAACKAIEEGELLGIYPEGSITKDPDGWPMRGKTGAAHIALTTGCPVIPVGQWGAQEFLPAYSMKFKLFPRQTTTFNVGEPVDLSDLMGQEITKELLKIATDRIMADITGLVEEIRGIEAPAVRFDPKKAGVAEVGRVVNKKPKKARRNDG